MPSKVEGTEVYRSNGDHVGEIERMMIEKRPGKVAYAVMSFGGFLGMGEEHYPLPWSLLRYNERLGGYEVNLSKQQLKGAPKFARDEDWDWSDRDRSRRIYDYYGATPYWMYAALLLSPSRDWLAVDLPRKSGNRSAFRC